MTARDRLNVAAREAVARAVLEISRHPDFAAEVRAMSRTHAGATPATVAGELMADAMNEVNLQEVCHG